MPDPSWAPTTQRVASYVPKRTHPNDNMTDVLLGDFTTATSPNATQVGVLITDAVAWVLGATGPTVPPGLETQATAAATLRAAGMVELTYPGEDQDVNHARELLDAAASALAALVQAQQDNPPSGLLPVYSFPDPPRWADTDFQ